MARGKRADPVCEERPQNDKAVPYLVNSIKRFGFKVPLVIDAKGVVVCGHTRLKAALTAGLARVPCVVADDLTPAELKAFRLADNKVAEIAEWDEDLLAEELDGLEEELGESMDDFGFGDLAEDYGKGNTPPEVKGALAERFVVAPFSVLYGYKGDWQKRKKLWREVIGDEGESREGTLSDEKGVMASVRGSVSVLDPVLSEIVCRWFAPKEGRLFDCFAGDSVFGCVSANLGYSFTGIELRKEQVDLNNSRVKGLKAKYICDDGQNVAKHIKPETQDLLFSCPPYFDLEVYSDKPNDASNQPTYAAFLEILRHAFTDAVKCLKQDRFAVIVVGDIRDKRGFYYDFPADVKRIFKAAGMPLYNELVLVDQVGSAAYRAANAMKNRKCVKIHQNVLVFYKGNPANIKKNFEEIKYEAEDLERFGLDNGNEAEEAETNL